jgi:hypothetical protein
MANVAMNSLPHAAPVVRAKLPAKGLVARDRNPPLDAGHGMPGLPACGIGWSRMKWMAWGLTLFLFAARIGMADDIALSAGSAVKGTVLRLTTDSILVLQEDGKTRRVPRDTVTGFTLDFQTGDRCAQLTSMDGKSSFLVVSSFENLHFAGKDTGGKPVALPLADTREAVLYPVTKPLHILDVPYVRQKPDYCGEACIEMLSTFLGRPVSQDKVNELSGLGGKRGCHAEELVSVIKKLDLKIASEDSWPGVTEEDFFVERMRLLACLRRNHPVLLGVSGHYQARPVAASFDHIVLLIGYDLVSGRFIIHDPGRWQNWEISFASFIKHRQNNSRVLCQIEFGLFRNWKTRDGEEIPAELLELNDQGIRLKPAKGGPVTLSMDKLDPSSSDFITRLKAGQAVPRRGEPAALGYSYTRYLNARECALRGDKAEALSFLIRAMDAGFINFFQLTTDKAMDSIRKEKAFEALLANKDRFAADFIRDTTAEFLRTLGEGYKVLSETDSPYIVIGGGAKDNATKVTDVCRTVSDLLGRTLFKNKPTGAFIVVIPASMDDFVRKLGGKKTSAGFYNSANRTLTINLSTGSGTVAHEFTHALHFSDMEARGQLHPAWVREGLGSLYEASDPKEDWLEGLMNWRLPILRNALAAKKTFPLRTLFENSDRCFAEDANVAYAMSRHVFFFLQRRQLLFPWYAQYCENYATDPAGIRTLEKVYGKTLDEFEADWLEFVKTVK